MLKQNKKSILNNWQLYVMILLPLIYLLIFKYYPMLGLQIAFKNYKVKLGIWGSEWVGFDHFIRFFKSAKFERVILNTLGISLYGLVAGFPFPIILAVLLNYLKSSKLKKTAQMVSYAPHFISTVVMVGLIQQFLNTRMGLVNNILNVLFGTRIDFLGSPEWFSTVYVWSGIWQHVGYSSIIYLATLSSIDPSLHEAAIIDGANKIQRIWNIDLPGIMPTAVILLIMNTGRILDTGFEKIYLMQNTLNIKASEVIDTYVYKIGLASNLPNYSYSTAIGLFKSAIGLILIITVNRIAKRIGETSLW